MGDSLAKLRVVVALVIVCLVAIGLLMTYYLYSLVSNQVNTAISVATKPFTDSISEALARFVIDLAKESASFDVSRNTYAFLKKHSDRTELIVVRDNHSMVLDRFDPTLLGSLCLSRDGQQLILAAASLEDSTVMGVFLYHIPTRKRVSLHSEVGYNPLLTSDGQYLILGTEQGVRLIDLETKQVHSSWAKRIVSENFSPDGKLLVEASDLTRFVVDWRALSRPYPPASAQGLRTSGTDELLKKAERVAWSPDGKWVAGVVRASTGEELWLVDTHGTEKRVVGSAAGFGNLRWTSDSQTLLFVQVDGDSKGGASASRWRYSVAKGTIEGVDW